MFANLRNAANSRLSTALYVSLVASCTRAGPLSGALCGGYLAIEEHAATRDQPLPTRFAKTSAYIGAGSLAGAVGGFTVSVLSPLIIPICALALGVDGLYKYRQNKLRNDSA